MVRTRIEIIDEAIHMHLQWVEHARKLLEEPHSETLPALSHTECVLGKMIDKGLLNFCDA